MTERIHLVAAMPCFAGQSASHPDRVGPPAFYGDISSPFASPARATNAA